MFPYLSNKSSQVRIDVLYLKVLILGPGLEFSFSACGELEKDLKLRVFFF